MSQFENDQLVCISGESGTGKSASLRNIENQDRWFYLGCEAGKRLPFKNNFRSFRITNPSQIYEAFDVATPPNGPMAASIDGVIVDTLTFLMDMYESKYVINSANGLAAWSAFAQYFKVLMQDKVVKINKPVIFLAHTRTGFDKNDKVMKTSIPIKGSVANNGVESYFSTVVSTKIMPVAELEPYKSSLLTITDRERKLGFKHVFQTMVTEATVGERIRSPMGMFMDEETFMDNDVNLLLKRLNEFYN